MFLRLRCSLRGHHPGTEWREGGDPCPVCGSSLKAWTPSGWFLGGVSWGIPFVGMVFGMWLRHPQEVQELGAGLVGCLLMVSAFLLVVVWIVGGMVLIGEMPKEAKPADWLPPFAITILSPVGAAFCLFLADLCIYYAEGQPPDFQGLFGGL